MAFEDDDAGMRSAWEKERKAKMSVFGRLSMESSVSYCMSPSERKAFRSKSHRMNRNYHELSEFQHRITPEFAAAVNLGNIHLPLNFWKELV